MPNYLNLKPNEAICPVCGKILTGHKKRYCGHTLDEEGDGRSIWWDYYVFECKDCKVKGTTIDDDIENEDSWTIPAEHLKNANITQKQINYIKFLYSRIKDLELEDPPYILNTNVARDFISQLYEVYVKQTIGTLERERFEECFKKVGYVANSDRWDENCHFHKNYGERSSVTIYYDKDKLILGKIEYHLCDMFENDFDVELLLKIQDDICDIKDNLELLKMDRYVTRDDAIKRLDQNKEAYMTFKKNYGEYERDYYDGIDDFPVDNQ